MALQPKPELTFEDWLQGERAALDERCEYVDGECFAMSGGSAEHHAIIVAPIEETFEERRR